MRELKGKEDDKSKAELEDFIKAIAEAAETNYNKVVEELNKMKPEEGRIDAQKFWKMKKRIFPKNNDPPSAMLDKDGNIITSKKEIEKRAIDVYTDRLKANQINEHLKDYEQTANKLCEARLKLSKLNVTEPWSMEDLEKATSDLENGKARDALDYANELFKKEVAGTDLKEAVLKLMNLIKSKQKYPECLEPCNITSLYKHKGSHKDFNNYRGVFRVTVFRSILDRLIYNDSYHIIDENLTDGNVGARKHRNIRDNIFVLGSVMNSVINGKEDSIQIQVQDVNKCFDKLWLQETTNALYETGLTNNNLNLLYLENKNAKVAIKINNKLTNRFSVQDVELQGSVWGSLKCTTSMDRLNKIILSQDNLTYHYKGDPHIKLGVLGMVDDNLAIQKCGTSSLQKNAVINSFIEMQRLTLSEEKSVVLHVGRKCKKQCPQLKVHERDMKSAQTVRYLGDIVSASGAMRPCIEDRRNKGWGKVSELKGILSELPAIRRVEIGLKLREAKVHNGILYNSEAWSNVSDADMERLEQVSVAALRALVDGHAKCSKAFYYLEFGVPMVRHIVMVRRIMYLHHIVSRQDSEIIQKVYYKQKQCHTKGDWIRIVQKDFDFIKEQINEEDIRNTPKEVYRKQIKEKVGKAAFQHLIDMKQLSKKKLADLHYKKFEIQPYMISSQFNLQEIKLLFSLRSKCYPAKMNFTKLNRGNLKCSFQCNSNETQDHIFEDCEPIKQRISYPFTVNLKLIYGSVEQQNNVIKLLIEIDNIRKLMKEDILPGGYAARTPVDT